MTPSNRRLSLLGGLTTLSAIVGSYCDLQRGYLFKLTMLYDNIEVLLGGLGAYKATMVTARNLDLYTMTALTYATMAGALFTLAGALTRRYILCLVGLPLLLVLLLAPFIALSPHKQWQAGPGFVGAVAGMVLAVLGLAL